MYAVIETGGKQYRVEVGTELEVELLGAEPGESVTLDRVLLVSDGETTSVGQPVVANAAVEAEVLRRARGEKLIVFKYRPKARSRVKKGHRQDHTVLRITDVVLDGKSAAEAGRKAQDDARTERQRLEEAAARQAAADAALAAKLAVKSDAKSDAAPAKAPRSRRAGAARKAAATDETVTAEPLDGGTESLDSGSEPTATAGDIPATTDEPTTDEPTTDEPTTADAPNEDK